MRKPRGAKRARSGRTGTKDHADFAGKKANRRAVQQLADAGSRRKKKAPNGSGPNAGEPSDEIIDRHLKDIRAAKAKHEKAKGAARDAGKVVTQYLKIAQGDGLDKAAITRMLADENRPVGEVVAERRAITRYERVAGKPLGSQWDLLDGDKAIDIEAFARGEQAGREGAPRDANPHIPGSEDYQRWLAGHQNGEAIAVREMGGNNGSEPPQPEA
jgi:hypothetical protein